MRQQGYLTTDGYYLESPLTDAYAALVASWIRDDEELFRLAPRTGPPITPAKVLGWVREGRSPLLLCERETRVAVAYGELNVLDSGINEYWLGHLLTDPLRRGRGLGVILTKLLIARAFERMGATCVSLVVFPENEVAKRCYRAAGMIEAGQETHTFEEYGRTRTLVRFIVRR